MTRKKSKRRNDVTICLAKDMMPIQTLEKGRLHAAYEEARLVIHTPKRTFFQDCTPKHLKIFFCKLHCRFYFVIPFALNRPFPLKEQRENLLLVFKTES